MWARRYWGAAYWGENYWPTATAAVPVAPPVPGTGGPTLARRRFELDIKPTKRHPVPERKPRHRRIPEVHVALSLTTPSAVVVAEVAIQPLLPVAIAIRLPRLAAPPFSVRAQVTNRLGLAEERIGELEAVLAAVMEDD